MTVSGRGGSEKSQRHQPLMPGPWKGAARKPSVMLGEYRTEQEGPPSRKRRLGGPARKDGPGVFSDPRDGKGRGREDWMRAAWQRVEGGSEIVAKARLSGFDLMIELAAGGRGVEARKGIAPDPGDQNAKPDAVRGIGGASRRNQKARVFLRRCQADRSPATGGRQRCRPPFCVRALPGSADARALRGPNLLLPETATPAQAR